jgi:RNA polymerase sigma-70 factor (ECF subfamily)
MTLETFLTFICLYIIGSVIVEGSSALSPELVDIELIKRCKSGDRVAFNELMLKHQKRIFNIMYRFCGNYEDAKDLTQDVFVKVFKSLGTLNEENKFKGWVTTIAANTYKNRYKYLKRRGKGRTNSIDAPIQTEDGEIKNELKDSRPIPDEQVHKERLKNIVQEKINMLKDDYKEVIILRDIQGESYEEISVILNISIGTVKSRIFRAREELKGHLAGIIDSL